MYLKKAMLKKGMLKKAILKKAMLKKAMLKKAMLKKVKSVILLQVTVCESVCICLRQGGIIYSIPIGSTLNRCVLVQCVMVWLALLSD